LKKLVTPFRVGLLVIASATFLFIFLTFVRKGGMSDSESIDVHAFFSDASGLGKKSRVQIAGIPVGEVGNITLVGTQARVTLRIRRDVGLRKDATLTKRSESLLGDYLLDLYPGSEASPPMPEGGEIRVLPSPGMEAIFETLSKITADIQQVTGALKSVLGGDKGANSMERIVENLVKLSDTVDATVGRNAERLDAILANFEAFSNEVRTFSDGQGENMNEILGNVKGVTEDVREVLAMVKKVLGTNEGDLKEGVSSLKQTISRLDNTLANLEEITGRVKNGEGAVGALVSDKRLGQKVSETVEDVSDFTSRLARTQVEVGIKSEYLLSQAAAKNTLGIRLIPKPDKYYLLEFVDDPRGTVESQIVQSNPPSEGNPVTQVQTVTRDSLKFSAQFAKRFYFTTLRFGIIESTGGVGADLHLLEDALSVKVDAFNFSVRELAYPRVRATLRLQAFQHLFATVGMDDLINRPLRDPATNRLLSGRDIFVGGGVFFTDDDLKAILPAAPIPSP
jgi:phospholipid/cholesterol/gamma-HCH transport system substrate-binding protein